jgi:hypothetical protein
VGFEHPAMLDAYERRSAVQVIEDVSLIAPIARRAAP